MKMETVVIRKKTELTIDLRRVPRPGGSEELAAERDGVFLKPERVQEWLQDRPAWSLRENGKSLHRAKAFPSRRVAERYGSFVAALAGALGQPMRVSVVGGKVDLSLYSFRERGRFNPLTEDVLTVAAQLG
jgi:hypothetical protein